MKKITSILFAKFNDLRKYQNKSLILAFVFLIIICVLHLKLVSDTFFVDREGNINSTLEGYGDVPLHMTQISKFAFEEDFNLKEPIYLGRNLQYHFLFNMIRGLILKFTNSWSFAFLWPVYLLVVINIFLIFYIYFKLIRNVWIAIGSLLIFYLGTGTAGWNVLLGESAKIITKLTAIYPDQNVVFGPILAMSFIHQQTFILGLTGFLTLLWIINRIETKFNWKIASVGIIAFALMPASHMHSYIAIVIFYFFFLISLVLKKDYVYFKNILKVIIPGIILSLPSVYFLVASHSSSLGNTIGLHLGWMVQKGLGSANFLLENTRSIFSLDYASFLFKNFGFILPIMVIVTVLFIMKFKIKNKVIIHDNIIFGNLRVYLWSAICIFILVQLIQFQTWDYDNNKLLTYFLFFASPVILWTAYVVIPKKVIIKKILIGLIIFILILSGLTDMYFRLRVKKASLYRIFDYNSVALAEFVKNNIDEKYLILTGTAHTNPVVSLAGKQILMGYNGWLWSRGVNYHSREKAIKEFYARPSKESKLLSDYDIRYILLDHSIDGDFIENTKKFDQIFDREFTNRGNVLYRVEK